MGTRAAAIVAAMLLTGCGGYGSEAFHCDNDTQCAGGTCETTSGFCTQSDLSCPSGRKYTDHSGSMSGTCVGGGPPIDSGNPVDARIDAPPDARACFGTAPFAICLAAPPSGPLALSTANPINTDTSKMCVATTSGGTGYCVLAGTTISVEGEGNWRATGSKPLVLIASDSITVSATLDVGSHRAANPEAGAGADPGDCTATAGNAPSNGGGGAGGSFTGVGGAGAASALGGSAGGTPGTAVTPTTLRGGCPGQDGQGAANDKGLGGHGGGAVLLIAVNSITINAGSGINAGGEGGQGGRQNTSGGGGGGAGGMIVLDASMVTSAGLVLANGGGGGEGSGETTAGGNGLDPTGIMAAAGGMGLANGGDGGSGSAGAAAGGGGTGSVGTVVSPSLKGGGGAGGGGAGLIKAPANATLGTLISPIVTIP